MELPHPEQVRPGKAAKTGVAFGDVTGKRLDDTFAPGSRLQLVRNICAHLPVKIDEFAIGGGQCTPPCRLDHRYDFGEVILSRVHRWGDVVAFYLRDHGVSETSLFTITAAGLTIALRIPLRPAFVGPDHTMPFA
jgi:hypothetical protein